MRRLRNGLIFLARLVSGFFSRWWYKGFGSACIFVRVAMLNFRISQANQLSARFPSLRRVECPCCGWQGYDFYADDTIKFWLPSVFCPNCVSHERQRMLHLYIHRHDPGLLTAEGRMLHFAAEPAVRKLFASNPRLTYISTEYDMPTARIRCEHGTEFLTDIQKMGAMSNAFDIVFCLHVLEHVRKDRDAIREILRVLKPGGVAYIMVPFDMTLDVTEEWEIPDPDIHYHIWAYATNDFKHRLDIFNFEEIKPDTFLTAEERVRYRIPPKEIIYRCVKPQTAARSGVLAGAAQAGR